MKILGIDPGTTRIGYGLIEKDRGLKLLDCGLIDGEGLAPQERLLNIERGFNKILERHRPDYICIEKLFFTKNKKTASAVSEARGVLLLLSQKSGVPVMEFSPSDIKAAVVGDGGADKESVKRVVMMTLKINDIPGPDDVSDALAIAIRGSFERDL